VHAADLDAGHEAARFVQPSLLIVDAGGLHEAIAFVRRLRLDPAVRSTGIAVFLPSPTLSEEELLHTAGANIVLSGEVDPVLWDRRLEEILNVPSRREARIPVHFKVWSQVDQTPDPGEAVALNISVHGMLMETLLSLEVGTKLDLRFELPQQAGEIGVVGEVVRRATRCCAHVSSAQILSPWCAKQRTIAHSPSWSCVACSTWHPHSR
jgi:hypothetical protein